MCQWGLKKMVFFKFGAVFETLIHLTTAWMVPCPMWIVPCDEFSHRSCSTLSLLGKVPNKKKKIYKDWVTILFGQIKLNAIINSPRIIFSAVSVLKLILPLILICVNICQVSNICGVKLVFHLPKENCCEIP